MSSATRTIVATKKKGSPENLNFLPPNTWLLSRALSNQVRPEAPLLISPSEQSLFVVPTLFSETVSHWKLRLNGWAKPAGQKAFGTLLPLAPCLSWEYKHMLPPSFFMCVLGVKRRPVQCLPGLPQALPPLLSQPQPQDHPSALPSAQTRPTRTNTATHSLAL